MHKHLQQLMEVREASEAHQGSCPPRIHACLLGSIIIFVNDRRHTQQATQRRTPGKLDH